MSAKNIVHPLTCLGSTHIALRFYLSQLIVFVFILIVLLFSQKIGSIEAIRAITCMKGSSVYALLLSRCYEINYCPSFLQIVSNELIKRKE